MATGETEFERPTQPRHVVGICGGAVAGSEAAALCADRGALTIVFEQNVRPYGKIEDGLPRWHVKLRDKEYQAIDANLDRPDVLFVPCTRLGRDISFEELTRQYGLSAVIMANGAWRDRPLPLSGVDEYVGRGLAYQNPLVYWFNHYTEEGYEGPQYEIPDGTIVVGGGLASIDVVKIVNFELYGRAMRARGVEPDLVEMETKGIPAVAEKHGLDVNDLGVQGVTLYYRRRKQDMPLASMDHATTPEQRKKIETARTKIMDRVMRKYLVHFEDLASPVDYVTEGGQLKGLVFRKNESQDGKLKPVEGSEREVRSDLVVSSIGSIPEPIEGVPMEGELYRWRDKETGELADGVYGLGNVLTGKGNIKESRSSARKVTERVVADYLGVGDEDHTSEMKDVLHGASRNETNPVVDNALAGARKLTPEGIQRLYERVQQRWAQVGYEGDYRSWIERHR
jgi:NADPH-dependent glutamate synthase beta subunit-like oxidoreductase